MEEKVGKNSQRNSYSVLRRISKKALIILILFAVPAILFLTAFHIKHVEVAGTERYTPEQINALVFQTKQDSNSLYLYLKYKFFSQPKLPFIEKLDVEMVSPSSVKIDVYEKMIAGCVEFMGEYLYFDKDGIVVESSTQRLEKVPVIKGLKFGEIILHEKLKVQKDELFDVIINLTQLINKYELDVDTISFGSNYDVTFDCQNVTVLLGKKDTYDEALAELKNILKEADGMNVTIDMRNFVKGMDIIGKTKKSTD
jgi:cell division protein FtsQ